MVNVDGEVTPTRTYEGARWQELKFNLTPAEARQLAAQLVAAADNHDGVGQDRHIMHRLDKIPKNLGGLIFLVRSNCAAALLRITASGRHPTPSTGWRADSVLERHGRDWPRVRQARHPFDDPSQLPLPGVNLVVSLSRTP